MCEHLKTSNACHETAIFVVIMLLLFRTSTFKLNSKKIMTESGDLSVIYNFEYTVHRIVFFEILIFLSWVLLIFWFSWHNEIMVPVLVLNLWWNQDTSLQCSIVETSSSSSNNPYARELDYGKRFIDIMLLIMKLL